MSADSLNIAQDSGKADVAALPERKRSRWRTVRWGCLGLLLFVCAGLGALTVALQSGPVRLGMPGGTELRLGSNDTVLNNYSFQNGTTYYFDLNGNGVRNILQLDYLQDSKSLELVLHHATRQDQSDTHLLGLQLP